MTEDAVSDERFSPLNHHKIVTVGEFVAAMDALLRTSDGSPVSDFLQEHARRLRDIASGRKIEDQKTKPLFSVLIKAKEAMLAAIRPLRHLLPSHPHERPMARP